MAKLGERNADVSGKDSAAAFQAVYSDIRASLLAEASSGFAEVDPHRTRYLGAMMDANVLGGKCTRGISTVEVAKNVARTRGVTGADLDTVVYDAALCGWAIEFMQAHFLVEDDIMDSSVTRRGNPCWYRRPGVTTQVAINDGLILFAWCTRIMEHFLRDRSFYFDVLQQLHRVDYLTTIGQLNDVSAMYDSAKLNPDVAQPTTVDYTEFTVAHYKRIVKYKTCYYTFHLPLTMGLTIGNGKVDAALVEDMAVAMGEYFQIQDDFLDCYGDPAVIGKIGTDIQDVKCSWLAVTFLSIANDAQVAAFKENYGQHDDAKVAAVKQLYKDVNVQGKFEEYEAATLAKIQEYLAASKAQDAGFGEAAAGLWEKTYKRSK